MTKIDIFSGFLGAGKTTLIKKLLKEAYQGEQVVLIENEFGEIGIDGSFLKDSGIEIREMNSGCICCSLVGDFGKSLNEVIEKYSPDRIIIEPSGVGKLSDVIKAVKDLDNDAEITLNSAVTVVDANKCKMYMKNFGEFFNNQIESAGTIVFSRTDGISDDRLNAAVEMVKAHNDKATIITTPWDKLSADDIIRAVEGDEFMADIMDKIAGEHDEHEHDHHDEHEHHHNHDEHEHHHHDEHEHHHHDEHEHHHHHDEHDHHHHHHADDVFTSVGIESPKKYSKDMLESILKVLANDEKYSTVLRAKGMVPASDGGDGGDFFYHFDLVPGEYEIRKGSPEYTGRICVIGAGTDEADIKKLFEV